jgi:hypothetical protein
MGRGRRWADRIRPVPASLHRPYANSTNANQGRASSIASIARTTPGGILLSTPARMPVRRRRQR